MRRAAERARQIVRQALEKRTIDEGAERAKPQLACLEPATRLAGEAVAEGDVTAIAPLMKAPHRLDRDQSAAKAVQVTDDEARRKLFDKTNLVAANLSADEARPAAEAAKGAPSGGEAAALRGAVSGERRLNEIPRLRGPRKSLKRLDPDKEIKENPKAFLWLFMRFLGPTEVKSASCRGMTRRERRPPRLPLYGIHASHRACNRPAGSPSRRSGEGAA